MKPPQFDYAAPQTLDEALALLSGDADAKLLAGGQSLVPLLNMRLAYPELLVDLRRVDGLGSIEQSNGRILVGSMVTQHEAETNHLLAQRCPLIADAARHIAHPQIRSRGTVGGSVAHADPAAELPAVVVALDATVQAVGPGGARAIPGADLYATTLTTALAEDEIVTAIDFPAAPEGSGAACVEVARRPGDYAMCGGVGQVTVSRERFSEVRLCLFGISDTPVRASAVEEALSDHEATGEMIAAATSNPTEDVELMGDSRASEAYSRQLASVVARRTLEAALGRTG